MDISLFLILTIFFLGIATAIGSYFYKKAAILHINQLKDLDELRNQEIAKLLVENIIELKAGNRYIISFPFDITEEELTSIIATLDLENSETHVVLVEGTVKVLEFS